MSLLRLIRDSVRDAHRPAYLMESLRKHGSEVLGVEPDEVEIVYQEDSYDAVVDGLPAGRRPVPFSGRVVIRQKRYCA